MMRKKTGIAASLPQGFTLIELLVVIAIIAVLASIALLSLAPAQKAGRDAKRIAELRQIQNALQLYLNACGYYPNADDTVSTNQNCPHTEEALIFDSNGGYYPDIYEDGSLEDQLKNVDALSSSQHLPKDPLSNAGRTYIYGVSNDAKSYVLKARLEINNSVLNTDTDGTVFGVDCSDTTPNYNYCVKF